MRQLYDACHAVNIPPDATFRAGYVDAGCVWSPQDLAGAKIHITSYGIDAGNCIDIEPGNAGAAFVPGWVTRARARGIRYPIVYAVKAGAPGSAAGFTWEDCVAACAQASVPAPLWWVSWEGATSIPDGAVAVQTQLNVSPGYDVSLAADFIPGLDPDPEEPMIILQTDQQPALFVFPGGAIGIPDLATEQALMAAGVQAAAVTASFYEAVYQAAQSHQAPPIPVGPVKIGGTVSVSGQLTAS